MLYDLIPARARKWVYGVLGFGVTLESSLDALDDGLLSSRVQGIVIAVAAAAGFKLAFDNVKGAR